MIIDAHAHVGRMADFNLSQKKLLEAMDRYGIDAAIVSSITGMEVSSEQILLDDTMQVSQIRGNEKCIEFARRFPDRFRVLLWMKPLTEGFNEEFERLYLENQDMIVGLKAHPYYSALPFNDWRYEGYIQMAERYQLPILIHTASDECSNPKWVATMAERYPRVKFILGHMELGSDHMEVIKMMRYLPNLYADTAWGGLGDILKAIAVVGPNRILFGSDVPIDGIDTYANPMYQQIFNEIYDYLPKDMADRILFQNAIDLFRL